MCFTRKKIKGIKGIKKNKIYPELNIKEITTDKFVKECITCYNCKQIFNLASNKISIHCAGCNQFFHCGIAGKCIGENCNGITMIGGGHRLSWCVNCVPNIPGNEVKTNGIGNCICKECAND